MNGDVCVVGMTANQKLREIAVQLDAVEPRANAGKMAGERALAGADF